MNTAGKNAILLVIFTLGVSRSAPVLFKVNSNISTIAGGIPTFKRAVRLVGKYGWTLQIARDGTVNGTVRCASKYAKLEEQTVADSFKQFKGIETGLFVAMNSEGNVYSSNSTNDETIFKETLEDNHFHTFASAKFYRKTLYDTFISLARKGKAMNGNFTTAGQKKIQFVIVTNDSDICNSNKDYIA
ncbi:fibroblast growth factor 1-like [Oculina patagonica]